MYIFDVNISVCYSVFYKPRGSLHVYKRDGKKNDRPDEDSYPGPLNL